MANSDGLDQRSEASGRKSYHACRPSSKGKYSFDVETRCIPLTLTKLCTAKSVEFIHVWKFSFIHMSGTAWDGDKCACGNSHTVGNFERANRETGHGDWKEGGENQRLVLGILEKKYGRREARPSARWVSQIKLSILYILSIPAKPSSLITASTSWRRDSIY